MSGTSIDGIDAAIIQTDGAKITSFGPSLTVPYTADFRDRLRNVLGTGPELTGKSSAVADELTQCHAEIVARLLAENGYRANDIDVIGFHGHTIYHNPAAGVTVQIGNGRQLADLSGIKVVGDLRGKDVRSGGQGAPLASILHAALARDFEKPVAVLNIGGVANVTWIGADANIETGEDLLAFDTGPGNAMIDDWMRNNGDRDFDLDGQAGRAGHIDARLLEHMLDHDFFERPAPKSLDRNEFDLGAVADCGLEDGAATLTAFTVETIAKAERLFPRPVSHWIVCGGGRKNGYMMEELTARLRIKIAVAEDCGWDGDSLEAQAFAFMAVRSLLRLPYSYPGTTGISQPLSGGVLFS